MILRDAWIEFSRIIRKSLDEDDESIGKNDVKGVLEAIDLPQDIIQKGRQAYNLTNALQHDTRAGHDKAAACFNRSTEAMAEIISVRFPGVHDLRNESLIRPN